MNANNRDVKVSAETVCRLIHPCRIPRATRLASITWLMGLYLLSPGSLSAQLSADDPLLNQPCGSCHQAGEAVDSSNAYLLTGSQEQLCGRCHPGANQVTHPSGVAPSMAVPSELPLDWQGNETCSTCHLVHNLGHAVLRVPERGADFCVYCHQQDFFDQMIDGGLSLFASAHLDALTDYPNEQTDPFSEHCLGCHSDEGLPLGTPGNWKNHPVTIPYGCSSCRPAEGIPEEILTPGGNVSCISCHQGYSQHHGAMVLSMRGSELCLSCHH